MAACADARVLNLMKQQPLLTWLESRIKNTWQQRDAQVSTSPTSSAASAQSAGGTCLSDVTESSEHRQHARLICGAAEHSTEDLALLRRVLGSRVSHYQWTAVQTHLLVHARDSPFRRVRMFVHQERTSAVHVRDLVAKHF